jgi:hypothetical protein
MLFPMSTHIAPHRDANPGRLPKIGLGVGLALVLVIAFGVARIAATYRVFNQMYDEPAHVAAGMEWLDRGSYTYERLHPPLARVAVALGPYLDGLRSHGNRGMWREGNAILYARDTYWRNLTLARLGVLPFFVAVVVLAFLWGRTLDAGNRWIGLAAAAALSLTPPVLAHAGLATTDMASTATITGALFALVAWLDRPTVSRSAFFGLALGLAAATKLSALVYVPAAGAAIIAVYLWRRPPVHRAPLRRRAAGLGIAAAVGLLVLTAVYRFSIGPLWQPRPAAALASASPARRAATWLATRPVFPARDYLRGLRQLRSMNREGRKNYVWGKAERGGHWYFFPFAVAVKTPLPLLILAIVGGGALFVDAYRRGRWQAAAPPAAALTLLGAAMASNINIGVRHVLPLYPLLAVCAAAGIATLWRMDRRRAATRTLAVVLSAWLAIASLRAHPDYLTYFNELAGPHPEQMLVDSDLDWGQDLARLADTVRARHIDRLSIIYHGSADLARHGLPPYTVLEPRAPVSGWVAASVYRIELGYMGGSTFDEFAWLRAYTPVAHAGRSIWLYFIPDAASGAAASGASLLAPNRRSASPVSR